MGYDADVNGYLKFNHRLRPSEQEQISKMLEDGWYEWEWRAQQSTSDSSAVYFWYNDRYNDMIDVMLDDIAERFPLEEGEVTCVGEDDAHWKFEYSGGRFYEMQGEIVYGPLVTVQPDKQLEFTAHLIDAFEGFLEWKGIVIPNEEKEDSGPDASNIYGTDFSVLQTGLERVLRDWKVIA